MTKSEDRGPPPRDKHVDKMVRLIRLINPAMTWVLRSPFHRAVSKDILLFTFQGRKTGRHYTTPISYIRDGHRIRCFTHAPWLKNLQVCPDVSLLLAGRRERGTAAVVTDAPAVAAALTDFLRRVPRDARFCGVRMSHGEPNRDHVLAAASYMVLIEVTLVPESTADTR